jgi:alpha-beta hydrolase superfamily lysophospholipase
MIDYGMSRSDASLLRRQVAEGALWADVVTALALRDRSIANGALKSYPSTAAAFFGYEALCWSFLQVVDEADSPRRAAVYDDMVAAFSSAQALDSGLPAHTTIATGVGDVAAWVLAPPTTSGPVVIHVGGLTGWGLVFHGSARTLATRGVGSILLELPGQGLTRMAHQTYFDEQFHQSVASVVDWIEATWGSNRIGIWGNSMGGLFAARSAAAEPRLSACCVNGAPANPVAMYGRFPRQWNLAAAMSAPSARSTDLVESLWKRLAFDPSTRVAGSLLVVHGGADILIPREEQAAFLGSWDAASLIEWPGGEHCVYNFAQERNAYVSDWFAARLGI